MGKTGKEWLGKRRLERYPQMGSQGDGCWCVAGHTWNCEALFIVRSRGELNYRARLGTFTGDCPS